MDKPAVLVVDDEPNVQETLATVLTIVGFKSHRAGNVEEALAVLAQERIDAISLDIRMPDPGGLERDGFALLKHLRTVPKYANVPVLLFTGVDLSEAETALAVKLRAKVFYKPQPYAEIIDELNRLLVVV